MNIVGGVLVGAMLWGLTATAVAQVVTPEPGPVAPADNTEDPVVVARVAGADPAAGQAATRSCERCHTFNEGGAIRFGPNLYGIVGAPVGRAAGFNYTPAYVAMREQGAVWTLSRLAVFLAHPSAMAPGTLMEYPGVRDEQTRYDILAYLRSLSVSPVLPEGAPPPTP